MQLPQIRTMQDAYKMIKDSDPNTSLSYYLFRQMILNGEIPSIKTSGRYLLNMKDVEERFATQSSAPIPITVPEEIYSGIRAVGR